VGLIITNCIIMGRAEAYAMHNPPLPSLLDGLGNGLGYGVVLIIVAFIRELFSGGKLLDTQVVNDTLLPFFKNGIMVVPAGAFFVIAILIWLMKEFSPIPYEDQ